MIQDSFPKQAAMDAVCLLLLIAVDLDVHVTRFTCLKKLQRRCIIVPSYISRKGEKKVLYVDKLGQSPVVPRQ